MKIDYKGELKNGVISGVFKQNGMELPLDFSRTQKEILPLKHSQEPTFPLPYVSENIQIKNEKTSFILSGTLTKPSKKGNFPLIVLISGSGPQNRDEEIMGQKPFLIISDYLTRNGFAVFRYDDRGVGESTGNFSSATTFDFADDADCIVNYFSQQKQFKKSKIGLMGHSEGGIVAPIVASKNSKVDFLVLLAGPGVSGAEILKLQSKLIAQSRDRSWKDDGKNDKLYNGVVEIFKNNSNQELIEREIFDLMHGIFKDSLEVIEKETGVSYDEFIKQNVAEVCSPWMKTFILTDPEDYLQNLKIPILALNGSKDIQVDPKQNLLEIERILKSNGNSNISIIEMKSQNHLFQVCKECTIEEYAKLDETFSSLTLIEIVKWLNNQNFK